MPAYSAAKSSFVQNAARLNRVVFCCLLTLLSCESTGTVGVYSEVGVRCDPLGTECGASRACSLRADPMMDACRDVDGVVDGEACTTPDACEAGTQCVRLGMIAASLDPVDLASGVCAQICARDVPECEAGDRCTPIIAAQGGIRIDYGVCTP